MLKERDLVVSQHHIINTMEKTLPSDVCPEGRETLDRGRDLSESPPSSPDLTSQEGSFCLPLEECLKRPKAVFIPPHFKQEIDLQSKSQPSQSQLSPSHSEPSQLQSSPSHSEPSSQLQPSPSHSEPSQLEPPTELLILCCQPPPAPAKRKRGRPKGYPKTGGRKKGTKNKPKKDESKTKEKSGSG